MSLTLMGLIPGGGGGCFGGEKKSLMRVPKPPKFAPQATANLLLTGRFAAGLERKNSERLLASPAPKEVCVKGASLRSRTLTGRSVKNCFKFDQKLSGMRMCGLPNFGTALAGTGIAGGEPPAGTLAFLSWGGKRSIK